VATVSSMELSNAILAKINLEDHLAAMMRACGSIQEMHADQEINVCANAAAMAILVCACSLTDHPRPDADFSMEEQAAAVMEFAQIKKGNNWASYFFIFIFFPTLLLRFI